MPEGCDQWHNWNTVTSGDAQSSIRGPVFTLFISDLDEKDRCLLSKFTDDIKLGGVANPPGYCAALGKDLRRLERWTEKICLKFKNFKGNP